MLFHKTLLLLTPLCALAQTTPDLIDVQIVKVVDRGGFEDTNLDKKKNKGDVMTFRIDIVGDAYNTADASQEIAAGSYFVTDSWSYQECMTYVPGSTNLWKYPYNDTPKNDIITDPAPGVFPLSSGIYPNAAINTNYKKIEIDFKFEITCDCETTAVNTATIHHGGHTESGTLAVDIEPTEGAVCGDPHFRTWSGEKYDYHGVCDLVLLQNPAFNNGLGMEIHIRTERTRMWSFITAATLQIGDDILEVQGGTNKNLFWVNKVEDTTLEETMMMLSGYPVTFTQVSEKSREFAIDLGKDESIQFKTWNSMVSVHFKKSRMEDFGGSMGLLGSYPKGVKLARDNKTIIDDANIFGQEWQVQASDANLFHSIEGPQYPAKCEVPSSVEMRRRLAESVITKEDAESACSRVSEEDFDMCVFDVMATNDKDNAGAY